MTQCRNHSHCQKSALDSAEQYCLENGLRLTDLRRRVLALVWESHHPVKAYDLMAKLPEEGDAPAQPPTVYRALDFLLEHGLIHRLDTLNAYIGCDHPKTHENCYFLLCTECGLAEECCADNITSAIRTTSSSHGFKASTTTLEITGICVRCQDNDDRHTSA